MANRHFIAFFRSMATGLCVAVLLCCACACRQSVTATEAAEIDSLNALSYGLRFTSARQSMRYADEVIARFGDKDRADGVQLAWLNKAYAHYMLMRYDSVKVCCDKVMSSSPNGLMRTFADVNMMLTCNMLGMSKEFYDYRNDAHDRLVRLAEEADGMTERQSRMYHSALAQFHIASLHYFVRMRLTDEVNESAEWLDNNTSLFADDATLTANHLMLKSMLKTKDDGAGTDQLTQQRRILATLLQISTEYGFDYITAEALHRLARSIVSYGDVRPALHSYLAEYLGLGEGESLGEALNLDALRLFENFGNRYTISRALVTLSDYKLQRGLIDEALPPLERALQMVNEHHQEINGAAHADCGRLLTARMDSTATADNGEYSTEMLWIADPGIMAVPVWMSNIREQLSVVFGAMGMKAESDYNHNIYFDILDATRQDQRVMQEKENLSREENMLNLLIVIFIAVLVLTVWAIYRFNRRSAARYRARVERLSAVATVCKNMAEVLGESFDDEEELQEKLDAALAGFADTGGAKKAGAMEREMRNVLQTCHEWVREKGLMFLHFANEERRIESETYALGKKYEESKKQYIEKLTSMSIVNGITPFLDRAMREVDKLKDETDQRVIDKRLQYIGELVDKINEYNEVLGHWVKIRQGMVTLSIENFALQPLLDTMKLSAKAFAAKGVALDVRDSAETVKADRSLTLFMMNTLLDNARKYTPEGGTVSLSAQALGDCVEIAVQDTGHGMSADDVATINGSKVYDSSRIGVSGENADKVKEQKGYGFGLMNCRGIIEKYRKTNALFAVCQFGVESDEGKGSRFFFRLPKGVAKALCAAVLMLCGMSLAASDALVPQAERYYEGLFAANVDGRYEDALDYADSAIQALNDHYLLKVPDGTKLLNLDGGAMAELDWWRDGFETDYDLIIGIRNEVAIAALALNRNHLYHYNSESFKQLYTLANTDHTLEAYCNNTRQANKNRRAIAVMLGLTIVIVLLLYFFLHYRRHQLLIFNMRQFIALNKRLFSASTAELPDVLLQGISDIKQADAVEVRPDGTMEIAFRDDHLTADEALIIDLVREFVSIHTYFSQHKVSEHDELLELKEDERRRIDMEQQRVHVQNMIMDNCMSALKHETMYYPNRIKQIVATGETSGLFELLSYYKQVFGLLSACAGRQVEKMLFKRATVEAGAIGEMARKAHKRAAAKSRRLGRMTECGDGRRLRVMADTTFMQVLVANVVSLYQEHASGGDLHVGYEDAGDFVLFRFTDTAYRMDEADIPNLFYADNVRYDSQRDTLVGMQYLITKQIIREHDKYSTHRGCRIYVENMPDGEGSSFVFTLQKA